jgi:S-DNA-T family DNA segregation ATPase FtsK/SpoIIIE
VILDTTGAERLLGQGDMLFQSPDAAAPVRLQGCFVSDNELNKLIHYWQTARRENLIPASESIAPRPVQPEPATVGTAKSYPQPGSGAGDLSARPSSAEAPTAVGSPPLVKREGRQESRPPSSPAKPRPSPPSPEQPQPTPQPAANKRELTQQPLWEALQELDERNGNDTAAGVGVEDELLDEAIALARKLNKASTSMFQRRFRIGYTRAARLIDAMEERGIIGPPTGTSKAREVIGAEEAATGSEAADSDDSSNEDAE